jgi:hypothetical protein
MAFTIQVTEENRSRLDRIKAHFGLPSMRAAIWFAVAKLWREIGGEP